MQSHSRALLKLAAAALIGVSLVTLTITSASAQYKMTVNRDRLINAQNEPQNWLMMNGDYGSKRYSKLTQINRDNVKNLRLVWALALGGMQDVGQNGPENEVNPLIDNGFMYTTDGWGTVYKIDARNPNKGEFVWITDPGVRHEGNVSRTRGIALWEDLVIANLPDGRVIAINRDSGEIVWDKKVAEGQRVRQPGTLLGPRRSSPTARCWSPTAPATARRAAGSRRSTSRPATSCGAGTPCPSRASPAARPGRTRTTPGRPAAAACGRPAPTTRRRKLTIWGTGNPVPQIRSAVAPGRQPLHQLGGRARHRHRQARLAFPIHAERLVGLRRDRHPHAVRHHDQRRDAARSSAISGATASSTRSTAPTAASSRAAST